MIPTDKVPVKLQYVEHLDQVWVVCWNQVEESGSKTVVVIRQASEDMQHHTVHTQPIANRFDLVHYYFIGQTVPFSGKCNVKQAFLPKSGDVYLTYSFVARSMQSKCFLCCSTT